MALNTKRDIVLLDNQFNDRGRYTAEVTELSMADASTLSNVIDARKNVSLVVRLRYKSNDIRQGFIAIKGEKHLYSIVKNVKVMRSNTFYVVESTRKNDVNV